MPLPKGIAHVEELKVEGKRVFVRVDLNVPLTKDRKVADDSRITAVLPTIKHLIDREARIILGSHLGRPDGQVKPELSLEPVAARLAELLGTEVVLADEPVGDGARKVVGDLREGQVAMLENLRFAPGEEANDDGFARQLASYCDVYINDAFGTAHRAHASTVGMVKHCAEKGAGFVMAKEIEILSRLLGEVDRPYLAVVGGAKVSDKIEVLDALLERVDGLAVGGAMANTFLTAQGKNLGKSKVEADKLPIARNFLRKASEKGVTVHLPIDVVIASGLDAEETRAVSVDAVPADMMALDIGPATVEAYRAAVGRARAIFWNGPMGVFEKPKFAAGTFAIAKAMADNRLALTVVGGGDSAAAVVKAGVADRVTHVSTGGGASLEFIQGLELPGITALAKG
ncbi:MAG TPA: phosphoglycerate kinase [Kofleriaceae bacterium]|nr:phosphoglycerate kinase [Kofleriaceae bacterium]